MLNTLLIHNQYIQFYQTYKKPLEMSLDEHLVMKIKEKERDKGTNRKSFTRYSHVSIFLVNKKINRKQAGSSRLKNNVDGPIYLF